MKILELPDFDTKEVELIEEFFNKNKKEKLYKDLEKIKAEIPTNEYIEKMIDFIQTSKRGVLLKSHKSGYQSLDNEE